MEAAAAAESLRCRKAEEEGEGRGHRGRCPCASDSGWSYFFRDNFFLVNEGNFWYHVNPTVYHTPHLYACTSNAWLDTDIQLCGGGRTGAGKGGGGVAVATVRYKQTWRLTSNQ